MHSDNYKNNGIHDMKLNDKCVYKDRFSHLYRNLRELKKERKEERKKGRKEERKRGRKKRRKEQRKEARKKERKVGRKRMREQW